MVKTRKDRLADMRETVRLNPLITLLDDLLGFEVVKYFDQSAFTAMTISAGHDSNLVEGKRIVALSDISDFYHLLQSRKESSLGATTGLRGVKLSTWSKSAVVQALLRNYRLYRTSRNLPRSPTVCRQWRGLARDRKWIRPPAYRRAGRREG